MRENQKQDVVISSFEKLLTDLLKNKDWFETNLRISKVYWTNLDYGFIITVMISIKSDGTIDIVDDQELVRDYVYVNESSSVIRELIKISNTKEILNT